MLSSERRRSTHSSWIKKSVSYDPIQKKFNKNLCRSLAMYKKKRKKRKKASYGTVWYIGCVIHKLSFHSSIFIFFKVKHYCNLNFFYVIVIITYSFMI